MTARRAIRTLFAVTALLMCGARLASASPSLPLSDGPVVEPPKLSPAEAPKAQAADGSVLVASVTDSGIEVYAADSAGQQTLVASLPEFRVGEPVDDNLWYLENASRLTVSLDGTKLAFTAQRAGQWALFVYDMSSWTVRQVPIPNQLVPFWSPDSSAVLLTVNSDEPQWRLTEPYNDYVYELVSGSVNQVTFSPDDIEWDMSWLPDSSGLFYVGAGAVCETCNASDALYYVSRDGSETRLLAIGDALAPADSFGSICDPTWSEPNQRIYFIIGCSEETPFSEYLYSVDLAGNTRAEIGQGLNSLFPNATYVLTTGIHPAPNSNHVFLTIGSGESIGEQRGFNFQRVLDVPAPDEVAVVYEESSRNDLFESSTMSPDGTSIALLTRSQRSYSGYIEVIDLATGQRTIGRDSTPLEVCEVIWEDDRTLFYRVDPTGNCYPELAQQSVWVLDTTTGATEEVSSGLSGNLTIVRQVEMTSPVVEPPTPVPTAQPVSSSALVATITAPDQRRLESARVPPYNLHSGNRVG